MLGVVALPGHDAVLCQLPVPDEAVLAAWEGCTGVFCLERSASSARLGRRRPDGREPAESSRPSPRRDGLVAVTLGAEGAYLLEDGEEIARAAPPRRWRSWTAPPPATRSRRACSSPSSRNASTPEALERACAAGALAASRFGAQPSLPTAAEVDAILLS